MIDVMKKIGLDYGMDHATGGWGDGNQRQPVSEGHPWKCRVEGSHAHITGKVFQEE